MNDTVLYSVKWSPLFILYCINEFKLHFFINWFRDKNSVVNVLFSQCETQFHLSAHTYILAKIRNAATRCFNFNVAFIQKRIQIQKLETEFIQNVIVAIF